MRVEALKKEHIGEIDFALNGGFWRKFFCGLEYYIQSEEKEDGSLEVKALRAFTSNPEKSPESYVFSGDCRKWDSYLTQFYGKRLVSEEEVVIKLVPEVFY